MREESQLDEMRAAIRGDFERLERRLGVQELMHVREPPPEPEATLEEPEASDLELVEPPRLSWLARLVAAIPPRQL